MGDLERRDLVLDLIKTLPRPYLSQVHAHISAILRRDLVGSLPRELSFDIFRHLDIASLLECGLVNKAWRSIANDQVLWYKICEENSIHANTSTSWRDIFAEREKVVRMEQEDAHRESLLGKRNDDPWDEVELENGDELTQGVTTGQGHRVDLTGEATLPISDALRRRRPSFRTGRQQSGLPVFLLPTTTGPGVPSSSSTSTHFPVLSHLPAPFPKPQVDYKHLYLTNDIIRRRFLQGQARPFILSAASSLSNGGLSGHAEGVYCLQIVNQEITIPNEKAPVSPPRRGEGTNLPTSISGRNWIFSGSRDGTVRLWDLNKRAVVKIYEQSSIQEGGHSGSVLTLQVRANDDGKGMTLISGGSDGKLIIWDVASGDILGQIQAHERRDCALSVRFDSKRIVCCSKDHSIKTYDAKTLEPLLIIGGPSSNVGVQAENHLLQADIPAPHELDGHTAAVNAIALIQDLILSVSGDGTMRVWSADTGQAICTIHAHTRAIASLDVDEKTGVVITGSSDLGVRIHNLFEWGFDFTQPFNQAAVENMITQGLLMRPKNPNGIEFSAGRDCCARAFSSTRSLSEAAAAVEGEQGQDQGQEVELPNLNRLCLSCGNKGHRDLVRSVWLGQDVVFSGSYDCTVKVWDRRTRKLVTDLPNLHTARIFSVVGDRTKVVSGGFDSRIIVWDFSHGLDASFVEM